MINAPAFCRALRLIATALAKKMRENRETLITKTLHLGLIKFDQLCLEEVTKR